MDTSLTTITTITVSLNTTDYTSVLYSIKNELISLNKNIEVIKYLLNDAHSAVPYLAIGLALIAGAIYLIRRI